MELRTVLALRGPNVWARFPVLEAWVDLKDLKDQASSEIPGFNERLQEWLPTLIEHRCSVGTRGGFFERLRRGTYLAHILEHVALELQSLAGTPVGFGRTRQAMEDGVYRVAIEYANEDLGRAAVEAARQVCLAAVRNEPISITEVVRDLRRQAERLLPPPSVASILDAAKERNIPTFVLEDLRLVTLGQGARQRRVLEGQSDSIGAIGAGIANDHHLARGLLDTVGVPVPAGVLVGSLEEALREAEQLGYPVTVRRRYGSQPATPNLADANELRQAWESHGLAERSVLVEPGSRGTLFWLTVVGDRVVAALAAESECEPDAVHPDVRGRAADAARVLGLDIATVELRATNLLEALPETGGIITAIYPGVEAAPLDSFPGLRRRAAHAILEHQFPGGQTGRIPLVGVTGVNGKTTTVRLTAHLLSGVHESVGMTCTEGIYVGKRRIHYGDCSGPKSARCILQHPDVQAAVVEVARGGILREGLGFDQCDVAVVTNIGEGDHLGSSDIETTEQLAWVKSTLVAAVSPKGCAVLNATDPLVVGMAAYCRGSVVYFSRDAEHPVIREQRGRPNGRAVVVREQWIVLATGSEEKRLLPLQDVPLTHGGKVAFHVENVLAATAAAWALGLPEELIVQRLTAFSPGLDQTPARFNIMELNGTTVVLDYGHNVSALKSLLESLEQFPHSYRSIVYSAAGDRRNADIVRQAELLGDHFDRVYLYEDSYLRGRKAGDIFALFRQGLAGRGRVREVIDIVGGLKTVEAALQAARPGELLVIQPDIIDDTVEHLRSKLGAQGRESSLQEALASTADLSVTHGRLGTSVVTKRPFEVGEQLLVDQGTPISRRTRHSIQVDVDRHVLPGEPLRYFNHSCEPNCGLVVRCGSDELEVQALRPIAAGEEVTLDYDTFEAEIQFMPSCLCGSARCRKAIRGYVGLPTELRESYGRYIAEYLREADVPVLAEARPDARLSVES